MKIEIEVNEEQFATVLQKTIAELPKEKLEELVLEGFRKYLEANPHQAIRMVSPFEGIFENRAFQEHLETTIRTIIFQTIPNMHNN